MIINNSLGEASLHGNVWPFEADAFYPTEIGGRHGLRLAVTDPTRRRRDIVKLGQILETIIKPTIAYLCRNVYYPALGYGWMYNLDVVSSGFHLTAGKYVGMASLAMVIYDHVLTFPREVERIWKQRITGATVLFLLNRYITPLQYIIFMDAYLDPRWTKEACDEFVVFEGAATAALVGVGELIMILRVYAFYGQSRNILCFLMVLWTCQIIISGVGLSTGFAVPFPPMLTGCILTGTSDTFPMIWAAPAVTDTFIFVLTLWRTRQLIRQSGKNATLELFLRDGIMYFFVIFMANLGNTLIYYLSPDDTKAVGAAFSQAITAVMVSRLVLNLRPFTAGANTTIGERTSGLSSSFIGGNHQPPDHSFMTRSIIGNLGSEFDTFQSYSFDAGQDVSDLRRADPENLDREFW